MARFQRGSLRVESRKNGQNWVLRYFVTRMSDGRKVEHKILIGLVHDFPTQSAAWAEVDGSSIASYRRYYEGGPLPSSTLSSRRQIDSPNAPVASKPNVAGLGARAESDAFAISSGPFV
jgi:hypothetical protein